MRVLATIGFSFSTGVFLAALLPWDGWQLYAAAGAALLALVWLLAARRSTCFRRGLLILLPLALIFSENSMSNLQTVSIIAAFPVGIIMLLIISSFFKDADAYLKEQANPPE